MFFKIDDQESTDPVTNPENLVTSRLVPKSPSEAIKPTIAPPPPPITKTRKKGGLSSRISSFLSFLLILSGMILFSIEIFEKGSHSPGSLQTEKIVVIPKDSGVNAIANILYREGVIETPLLFNAYVLLEGKRSKFKAGEFGLKPHMSIAEVVNILIEGKTILHTITIPEGLTSEQIVARLTSNDALSGPIPEIPKEGSLLPDTYKFERGMSRYGLIQKMQRDQEQILNQIWSRNANGFPLRTKQELVILASIVEKETGRADERSRVAAVFLNRLAKGMKLQSDPTIVYGLVGGKGTLGRGILRTEIREATPYNTYVIDGLPPGPIANPGRAAMEAVANPSRTKDLFFVADGTGGHIFAENYEQHQKNVTRWRQIEKNRADTSATEPAVSVDRTVPEAEALPATIGSPGTVTPGTVTPGTLATTSDTMANSLTNSNEARPRAFDASEGTEKDPLQDNNYDLNSPQNVPAFQDE